MSGPDVAVIGGGPGGSAAATMLARKGLRVLLLEREVFPRRHIGESLLPASLPVLEELGVMEAVRSAGFLEKWGATMVWGTGTAPWSWYFRETNTRYPHAYQVWRPTFDQILLENARASGVDVREGHHVQEVLFESGRAAGVRYTDAAGRQQVTSTSFIVDASGQAALLGHRLKLREWDSFFQNLAVYAYFEGARRLPPPDENNIFIESYPAGWFWNIPIHGSLVSVGAVVDSRSGQEGLRSLGQEGYLRAQIAAASHTAEMLSAARMVDGPYLLKDWSYVSREVVGEGFVLVGDAACFIDPLFSSGVHLALTSGVLAAAYVATALKDPLMAPEAAAGYKELYYTQYGHFREMARLFYSSNRSVDSYFWEARRILGEEAGFTPRQAFVRAVAGQPPRGYERAVLEQGDAPEEFVSSVRAVERARRERLEALSAVQATGRLDLLLSAKPALAAGARIVRKPVLGEGEFVWGDVLVTPSRPEGSECSQLVASLLRLMDGSRTVAEIVESLVGGASLEKRAQAQEAALAALRILFVEGAVTGLVETPAT